MIRIVSFLVLSIFGLLGPVLVFVVGAVLYALYYTAYELLLIAGMIDVYYGNGAESIPYFLVGTTVGLLVVEFLKPYISLYNQ